MSGVMDVGQRDACVPRKSGKSRRRTPKARLTMIKLLYVPKELRRDNMRDQMRFDVIVRIVEFALVLLVVLLIVTYAQKKTKKGVDNVSGLRETVSMSAGNEITPPGTGRVTLHDERVLLTQHSQTEPCPASNHREKL